MGTIRERKPGHFELRAYVGRSPSGSPKHLQETYVSPRKDTGKRAAEERLKDLERRADAKKVETTSFGALLDDWLEHGEAMDRSPTTMHGYRTKAKVIRAGLGSIQLSDLTAKDLDRWYGKLRKEGVSPAQIMSYHRIIHAALHKGRKWGAVPTNVAEDAEPPRVQRQEITPPTVEQVGTLIRLALTGRTSMMAGVVMWAALTGMRRGEICGLRWSDVLSWNPGLVHVQRAYFKVPDSQGEKDVKTHQSREIPVSAPAMAVLRDRLERVTDEAESLGLEYDPAGYVWSTDYQGKEALDPDRLTKALVWLCRKAERPALDLLNEKRPEGSPKVTRTQLPAATRWEFRFHDLRHFAATQALRQFDVVTVSKILGHERASTTSDIYGHGVKEEIRAASDHLGTLLVGAMDGPNVTVTNAALPQAPTGADKNGR